MKQKLTKEESELVREIASKKNREIERLKDKIYNMQKKMSYLQGRVKREDYIYELMHTAIEIACEDIPTSILPAGKTDMSISAYINRAKEKMKANG